MLKLSSELNDISIISLRTGGPVAMAVLPILNPHNLKIVGWWCKTPGVNQNLVLMVDDVREVNLKGIAIDDEEDLTPAEELVRHRELLEINYELIGKPVKTKSAKIGKVTDFSYNEGMFVQKLYVERPLHKVFTTEDTLLIDRTQILEVTDHYILIKDTDIKSEKSVPAIAAEAA